MFISKNTGIVADNLKDMLKCVFRSLFELKTLDFRWFYVRKEVLECGF